MEHQALIVPAEVKICKNLTEEERKQILHLLLQQSKDGVLSHGAIGTISQHYNCNRRTVSRLWLTVKAQMQTGAELNVRSNRFGKCGRKKHEITAEAAKQVPLTKKHSYRSFAHALGTNKSTLHRLGMTGDIRSHSSAIKSLLTADNERRRLKFSLSKIIRSDNFNPCFEAMYDTMHIDEKWFFMTKVTQKYYLHKLEEDPYRACKLKRFIPKIMFMAAVARPRFSDGNVVTFDGKIGIFPFTFMEPTKRSSKNRAAGVLETKGITSINKEVIKRCVLEEILPAIKSKWPIGANRRIVIQQDNARPHLDPNDPDFVAAAQGDGWDIRLACQPPNNPDLNILDLGFFQAIQSLQQERSMRNVDELCVAVKGAFEELQAYTLNKVWLSLQLCMCEIMRVKGSNKYKIPHNGKDKLFQQGTLPIVISLERPFIDQATMDLENMTIVVQDSVEEHFSLEEMNVHPN